MTTLLFSLVFLLTGCAGNNSSTREIGDRVKEGTEYHIKDGLCILKHDDAILPTGWYYVIDTPNGFKRQLDKSGEAYYIDPNPIITAKNITTIEINESSYEGKSLFGLVMRLDKIGAENWSEATKKSVGKKLAFVLDDRLLEAANVFSPVAGGVTALNRNDYSRRELEKIKAIIESEK